LKIKEEQGEEEDNCFHEEGVYMDYNNKALNPSSTACNLKLEVRNCGK
jgi:hypothetical protein